MNISVGRPTQPEELTPAEDCGTTGCVGGAGAQEAVRDASRGDQAAADSDTVASTESLTLCASVVRSDGWTSVAGPGGESIPVAVRRLPFRVAARPTCCGRLLELHEVLALAAHSEQMAWVTAYPPSAPAVALDDLSGGRILGCAVIVPDDPYVMPTAGVRTADASWS